MKRIVAALAAFLFAAVLLSGCAGGNALKDGEKSIVATVFPQYDWLREILGEHPAHIRLTLLEDSGTDLHNYQPTAKDILSVSKADCFVYIGGNSDQWVADVLKNRSNPDRFEVNLMELLGNRVKEEELVEGMEGEEDEEEESPEYDEHIWLSLRNADLLVEELAKAVSEVDPENEALYTENANAYREKLSTLEKQYAEAVQAAGTKTLLFADRFPFRYLTEDYGLQYYAAFVGCSAETEASFETIVFLSNKVDELGLKYVLKIEGSDGKIASTVIRNTKKKDQKVLTLDSLQSADAANKHYLQVMEDNLTVLKEALQ